MKTSLRYCGGHDFTSDVAVIDAVVPMLDRIAAVADLMRVADNCEVDQLADATLGNAMWSIMAEAEDAKTVLDEWLEARRTGKQEDPLAGVSSRSLIYRGILDSVGGSLVQADQIMLAVDRLVSRDVPHE